MMMMMPMEEVEVVEEEEMGTEEIKRKRRSALPSSLIQVQSVNDLKYLSSDLSPYFYLKFNSQMNEVSRKVLQSLDAVIAAEKDHGKCLHQIICENNKFSRDSEDNQKLWMPVWRFKEFNFLLTRKEKSSNFFFFFY